MTKSRVHAAGLLLVALTGIALAAGCRRPAPEPEGTTYELRGQVLDVRADIGEIRIDHEAIPGYMDAMTMSFKVRDRGLLAGKGRGDLVKATMVVTDTDAWLSTLEKTGHRNIVEVPEGAAAPAPAFALLEPGQLVPEEPLLDHEGHAWSPAILKGKTVAMTFIYTRCPLPTYCPLMDRHFRAVQQAVAGDAELRGRVHLVSVTLDPAFDTPPVLKQHAASIGADTSTWTFVTGPPEALERFGARLGLTVMRSDKDSVDITHNLRTAIVRADGTLVKVIGGNAWTPADLMAELRAIVQ